MKFHRDGDMIDPNGLHRSLRTSLSLVDLPLYLVTTPNFGEVRLIAICDVVCGGSRVWSSVMHRSGRAAPERHLSQSLSLDSHESEGDRRRSGTATPARRNPLLQDVAVVSELANRPCSSHSLSQSGQRRAGRLVNAGHVSLQTPSAA